MNNTEPKHISEFILKWQKSLPQTMRSEFEYDTHALMNQKQSEPEPQPSDKVQISKHTLVEVNRAFRALKQDRNSYIHKVFSDDGVFDAMMEIYKLLEANFGKKPTEQPQPELNEIERAYEDGKKIRRKDWQKGHWIKKHSDTEAIDEPKNIYDVTNWAFRTHPENWEIYTEPTVQPSSQVILDNSFDRERFEAMFRAVVASNRTDNEFIETEEILQQLDAYYASKEGGVNE